MVGEVPTSEEENVEIPNWIKWAALVGAVVWLIMDPKGMASVVGDISDGVVTFFKELA